MSRIRNIQDAALAVVERLRQHEHQALWAGGSVRDMLLGHEPADIDIATDAPPERVCEIFSNTRRVGAVFGVVLVKQGRFWIETATFRTDLSYKDGRRPEGIVYSTPEEDAKRRDFTINGLFFDPIEQRIIDYIDGQADLRGRIIRAIGEPDRRFAEDHLRLLRAVRFATRFDFEIEPLTAAAIRSHAPDLRRISPERIREELGKMLSRPARGRVLALVTGLGLLPHLWPGAESDISAAAGDLLDALPERADFELSMAALLRDRPQGRAEEIGRALRCSNQQIADMSWLVCSEPELHRVEALSLARFKRLLAHPRWPDLLALHAAVLAVSNAPPATHEAALHRAARIPRNRIAPPPFVIGDDLIALGLEPGPRYKQILDALYDAQLNEEFPDRPAALARLREIC